MKVLLIGNNEGSGSKRLKEEFEKRGHEMRSIKSVRLVARIEDGEFDLLADSGESLMDHDVYFFRATLSRLGEEIGIIASELRRRGKVVMEPAVAERRSLAIDKLLFPYKQEFSVPNYKLFLGSVAYREQKDNLSFPLIVKSTRGSMGKKVRKVNNESELDSAVEELRFPIIIQRYIPIDYDVRVMVIDGKILGAFTRYNKTGDFLTSRRGGGREVVHLSGEMESAALEAYKLSGLKVVGVDLVEHEGKVYVLEANASPQFGMFEKVTGINVAERIVAYLEEEYDKQNKTPL